MGLPAGTRGDASQERTHAVVIVGTGFAGIAMAIALKQAGVRNFVILEKADRVGGTWRENTYPGCACDIRSHLYSYSFEPKADWKPRVRAGSPRSSRTSSTAWTSSGCGRTSGSAPR